MTTDELRDIPGFPYYAVTRDGRVWSKPRKDRRGCPKGGRWLSSAIMPNHYWGVHLYRPPQRKKTCPLHEIVLLAWRGPRPPGYDARHLDGNRDNNHIDNLCWGTRQDNILDNYRLGTMKKGEESHLARLHEDEARIIFHAYHDGIATQAELARAFGVSRPTVSVLVEKKTWKHLWTTTSTV